MIFLPTIRLKDPITSEIFDLSLQEPFKVNGTLITKYSTWQEHEYVKSNTGLIYILPGNYIEIMKNALRLHERIYNQEHSYNTIDFRMRAQSVACSCTSCILELNDSLSFQGRHGIRDYQASDNECILYDSVENKAAIYDHGHIRMIINDVATNYECIAYPSESCTTEYSSNNETRLIQEYFTRPITVTFDHSRWDPAIAEIASHYKQESVKNYIHSYNYVPEYIKHFMPGESEDITLLLGAEIEVGGNDTADTSVHNMAIRKCIQIMNGSDSDDENLIYSTHDSTVQIEFDTMPCSLEFHKNKMNYREMFKYLDKQGYKGHDCETAGLHIHANRSYLGKSRMSQELVISKILYILEKFNDEICVIARRNNEYSEFVGNKKEENSLIELYGKYKDRGKRAALNLQHKDTIEFRMFRSTLKYETFIIALEFVKDIIDFAKSTSIEEIELIKWRDFMESFSPALRDYYTERYNKQYKKSIKEDEAWLKRKISTIKKTLSNCKNYMMRVQLQKEYEKLMKQYNKIHRKNKYEKNRKMHITENTNARIDRITSAGAYDSSGNLIYI